MIKVILFAMITSRILCSVGKKESRNSQFVTKLLNLLFLFSILGHDFSSYFERSEPAEAARSAVDAGEA